MGSLTASLKGTEFISEVARCEAAQLRRRIDWLMHRDEGRDCRWKAQEDHVGQGREIGRRQSLCAHDAWRHALLEIHKVMAEQMKSLSAQEEVRHVPSRVLNRTGTSLQHLTCQRSGWWESFRRRSLAFYAQSICATPSCVPVELNVVYCPGGTDGDLLKYAEYQHDVRQHEVEVRRERDVQPTPQSFAVVREWSAAKDAVELVLHPNPSENSTTHFVGPRFVIQWALDFLRQPHVHPAHPRDAAVIGDKWNVAGRPANETEVRAHCCTDYAETSASGSWRAGEEEGKESECTCEWHACASSVGSSAVGISGD